MGDGGIQACLDQGPVHPVGAERLLDARLVQKLPEIGVSIDESLQDRALLLADSLKEPEHFVAADVAPKLLKHALVDLALRRAEILRLDDVKVYLGEQVGGDFLVEALLCRPWAQPLLEALAHVSVHA